MLTLCLSLKQKLTKVFPTFSKTSCFSNPYRVNCKRKGGGNIPLFSEDLQDLSVYKYNESCYVEMILKKWKWLINYSYNPTKNNISSHLESLSWYLDLHTSKFENILVIGDLNIFMENNNMKHLRESCNLKRLIKVRTCFTNHKIPRWISKPKNFQNSYVIETSLFDFHKMTLIALKIQFLKLIQRVLFFRDYTKFSNETFINFLKLGFLNFCKICTKTLNKYAPCKRKTTSRNQTLFIDIEISKAVMKRNGSL